MHMKQAKGFVLSLSMVAMTFSAAAQHSFQRVSIGLPDDEARRLLHSLPVAADHGLRKQDALVTDLRDDEVQQVREAGLKVDVLQEDMERFYTERGAETAGQTIKTARADGCGEGGSIGVPPGFTLGSMAGYFTYDEFLWHLDNMAALYPQLITARQPVGDFLTFEGRPIYWVRISDNAQTDEPEPAVLYTALHHAREAVSLSQLVFYMYHVLAHYGEDAQVTEALNHTEMYFIPMLNPDGYIYNETTNPNGGGMWRKNRRNNGNGTFGVDLNRNYSVAWGGAGTSANGSSDVYRGPFPMSEPEVQAMEWFADQHQFVTNVNFHSYADMLLFPWGYTDAVQCDDHLNFLRITDMMVADNGYLNQQSSLLYPAAGDSDDWGYGELSGTRPPIYSMTCEVGDDNDGFWPGQDRIIPLCVENVTLNLRLALSATVNGLLTDRQPLALPASGHLRYDLQRAGWQDGTYTVSVQPLQGFASVGGANVHTGMGIGDVVTDSVAFTLQPSLVAGDVVSYVWVLDNGIYSVTDTVERVFGQAVELFSNNAQPTSDWLGNSTWGLTQTYFVSAPSSITDSPSGDYPNSSYRQVSTAQPIDLSGMAAAVLRFHARWEIEQGWDYAQVSASADGVNYQPLCGNYTVSGNANQDEGQPLYDGLQPTWVQEQMDLGDYVGGPVWVRFSLTSDQSVREDGIYVDDVEVVGLEETLSVGVDGLRTAHALVLMPNPSEGMLTLRFPEAEPEGALLTLLSATGQTVVQRRLSGATAAVTLDLAHLSGGLYMVLLETDGGRLSQKWLKR
jgi:carboxypeptidase T